MQGDGKLLNLSAQLHLVAETQKPKTMKITHSLKQTLLALALSAGFLGYARPCCAAEEDTVWLSSLDLKAMTTGWGPG